MSMYSTYGRMFHLNNFEQVAQRYRETKPIAGKNAHLNIIPVDDRKRKFERIEKISDDCYAIYNGELGDSVQYSHWSNTANKLLTPEIALALAPIVWTRVNGGYTIRIRNGSGDYSHVSRYSFLNRAMPRGLSFMQTGQGRQYITCGRGDYYLPKSNYLPNTREYTDERVWTTVKDDHYYLTFFHDDLGDSASHSTGWKPYTNTFTFQHPKKRVDKEEKAKHKENTDKFWDWICAVAPLMPMMGNYDSPERANYDAYNSRMSEEAVTWLDGQSISGVHTGYHGGELIGGNAEHCAEIIKDVMADEEHPLRLPLAWVFVNTVNNGEYSRYDTVGTMTNVFAGIDTQEEASKVRAKYNRWINRQLNLLKHHEPSKVIVSESLTKKEK